MVPFSRNALLIAAGLGLALVGCSNGSTGKTATSTGTPTPTSSSPATVQSPSQVAVSTADLGTGWQERVFTGGTEVQGEVTLDLCGGGYRSEAMRASRYQIAMRLGPLQLSNEVVRYETGGAQLAFNELKQRLTTCPKTPVTMPEAGGIRAKWTLSRLPNDNSWPADTLAIRGTVSAQGHTSTSIGIYEFDGDWMAAVYTQDASAVSVRQARRVAAIEARKLRAAAHH